MPQSGAGRVARVPVRLDREVGRYIRTGVRKRKRAPDSSYLTLSSVPYGTALDVPPLSHDTIAAAIRTLCAGELLSTAT